MNRRAALASLLGVAAASSGARAERHLPPPLAMLRQVDPPKPVLGLAIRTAADAPVALEQFRGRFIIMNLWASWCFPCREEMPALSRLVALTGDSTVGFLPLAIERHGAEAVQRFYRETGIANLPVLLGDGRNIAGVFGEWGLPFTVLVDGAGREVARVTGSVRWDDADFVRWLTDRAAA